ncbi:MAG: hypothetical protein JW762_01900 [Dehalococcoidales bacterium]|nr:hypothetical protein [Dehalococcoidales bacterium]
MELIVIGRLLNIYLAIQETRGNDTKDNMNKVPGKNDGIVIRVIRKRLIKGLIQTIVLFLIFWGFSFLQDREIEINAFHRAAWFSILAVAGYTLYLLYTDLEKARQSSNWYNAGTAIGMVAAGIGLWQSLISFDPFRVWPGKTALILLCGLTGLALSQLANYRGRRQGGLLWNLLAWLENAPSLKFLSGILIGIYLVYLRPYLNIDPNSLIVFEWFLFCTLSFGILLRVWMGTSTSNTSEEAGKNWRKHKPDIVKLTGTSHDYMSRVERHFLNTGESIGLYVLLIILLHENRISEQNIVRAMKPLIDFTGINELRQGNLRFGRRFLRKQRELRLKALDDVFINVNSVVPFNRIPLSRVNLNITGQGTTYSQEEMSIDRLRQQFLEMGEKAGLIVRLILLLYQKWRNQEYIVNDMRELVNNSGEALDITLRRLLGNLNQTAPVSVSQQHTTDD